MLSVVAKELVGQGPVVAVLILGIWKLMKISDADRTERKEIQTAYLSLFKEINDTLNEYTKVIEGLNQGFQIIVNHILNNKKG